MLSRTSTVRATWATTLLALVFAGFPVTGAIAVEPPEPTAAADPTGEETEERPDSVSAMTTARLTKKRVEDVSQRTEIERVFANPDGSWTSDLAAEPVRMQDGEGEWHGIDTELVAVDGGFAPRHALGDLVVSDGGDSSFASMDLEGKDVSWRWPEPLPEPVIKGSVARYPDVADNADLVVTATATGFRHDIVLDEAPTAPTEFRLPVVTSGPKLTEQADGGLVVETRDGKDLAEAAPPVMYDSSEGESAAEPENTERVDATVTPTSSGSVLTLKPDQDFLTDPATQYPVTIDPTYSTTTQYPSGDAWVGHRNPDDYHPYDETLHIGTDTSGSYKYRSFIKWATGSWKNYAIRDAKLLMRNFDSMTCSGSEVRVARATETWPGTVTWNTQPTVTATGMAVSSSARGYSSSCPSGDISFDMDAIVTAWSTGGAANYGVRVAAANETVNSSYRAVRSANYATQSQEPRLVVTYDRFPNTPQAVRVSPRLGDYSMSATPTFSAAVSDGDSDLTRGRFNVYNAAGTLITYGDGQYVASGGTSSYTVPAGKLSEGVQYTLRAFAYDGSHWSGKNATSGGYSETKFTVDSTKPSMTLSSSGYANSGEWKTTKPASNVFTLDGAADVSQYRVEKDGVPEWVGANAAGDATVDWNPTDGGHTLKVTPTDKAGNAAATQTFTFGSGAASMTSPIDGDRSSSSFAVAANSPGGATGAKVQWRVAPNSDGTAGVWADATAVKNASGSGWTGAVNSSSTGGVASTPELIWDPQAESGVGELALLEMRVSFNYPGGPSVATEPIRVQVIPHAFGGSFPTQDIGPGQVSLFTGEQLISETDVQVPGYGETLTLSRTHLSMAGAPEGASSAFGPGWNADLTGPASGVAGYAVNDRTAQDGSITLTSPMGQALVYRHSSGTKAAQLAGAYKAVGEAALENNSLQLTAAAGQPKLLTLTESDGSETVFEWIPGAAVWAPESVKGPEVRSKTTFRHDSDGMVTWIFAPSPTGVVCTETTQSAGCRALHLSYTGSGASKRLTQADLITYDPKPSSDGSPGVSGAGMRTVAIAKYSYDTAGRLAAAWDPRKDTSAGPLKRLYEYGQVGGHVVLTKVTEPGLKPWTFNYDNGSGRLTSVARAQDAGVGGADATWQVIYGLAGGVGIPDLAGSATAAWGQPADDAPIAGAAIFGPDHPLPQNATADDWSYGSLFYWSPEGRQTNTAVYGGDDWQVSSTRYDAVGNTVWTLGPGGRRAALQTPGDAGQKSAVADRYATINTFSANGARIEQSWSPTHEAVDSDGVERTVRTVTTTTYDDETSDPDLLAGRPTPPTGGFEVVVQETEAVTTRTGPDSLGSTLATRSTTYGYEAAAGDGSGWTLRTPTKVAVDLGGTKSVTTKRFDNEGKVIETRTPGGNAAVAGSSARLARTMQNVYYSADASASRSECRNKPQWADQLCWHGPAGQPASGQPVPAVSTVGYGYLLTPTRVVETSGSASRAAVTGFDDAGRPVSRSVTTSGLGTADKSVPSVNQSYSDATGRPTTVSSASQTQVVGYDTWGRIVTVTDGAGNTASTSYDAAGRVRTVNDGKGTYSYSYNGTDSAGKKERRGLLTGLDAGGPTIPGGANFSGAYDANGQLARQTMPGGVTASWNRDVDGAVTELAYTQNGTDLIAFSQNYDVFGRVQETSGPDMSRQHSYDERDRLTSVSDTVEGSCETRRYGLSLDSNRLSAETSQAADDGTCQTSAVSATKTASYDDGDRITTGGYSYDALGRTLEVPGAETDGSGLDSAGALSVGYHSNDMVARLAQTGKINDIAATRSQDFGLDANNRISQIKDNLDGVQIGETTNHYASLTDSPSWSESKSRPNASTPWSMSWNRYVTDLAGSMSLVQTTSGANLQLSNLHGDISAAVTVGTPGIVSYTATDEFGNVPIAAAPSKARYMWLGAAQRQNGGVLGGLFLMGARLYNPRTGRFLTRDPIEGGNDNTYIYPADPVNMFDLDGCRCRNGALGGRVAGAETRYYTNNWRRVYNDSTWYGRMLDWASSLSQVVAVKAMWIQTRLRIRLYYVCRNGFWSKKWFGDQHQYRWRALLDMPLWFKDRRATTRWQVLF